MQKSKSITLTTLASGIELALNALKLFPVPFVAREHLEYLQLAIGGVAQGARDQKCSTSTSPLMSVLRSVGYGEPVTKQQRDAAADALMELMEEVSHRQDFEARPRQSDVGRRAGLPRAEANLKAREFLSAHPNATVRDVANGIGCSEGMISKLDAWKAVMGERQKGRKPKSPKVVPFTEKVEAATGKDDEELKRLTGEQAEDQRHGYKIRGRKL